MCEAGAQLRYSGSISASLRGQVDAVIAEPHWQSALKQILKERLCFCEEKHCSNKP